MFGLEEELKEKVKKHLNKFSRVLKECLKIKKEEVLIISDYGVKKNKLATMMGYGYYRAAIEKGFKTRIIFQDVKKSFMQVEENVLRALDWLGKRQVIILCLSNRLGRLGYLGKSFRFFCQERGHRFISTLSLGDVSSGKFDIFMEAINVNYRRMKKVGLKLKNKFDKAETIRIKTEKGTDVLFRVGGKKAVANIGEYKETKEGGNIPAGEVYIPPKGFFGVEGVVVVDGSMRCDEGTFLLKEPLRLIIKKGKLVQIEGFHKSLLEKTLIKRENRAKYPERVRLIGELGIGINPKAVLVGSAILDEKVLGTAHIAIGSNHWFGGDIRTILHLDQVFLNPKIFVDGERVIL